MNIRGMYIHRIRRHKRGIMTSQKGQRRLRAVKNLTKMEIHSKDKHHSINQLYTPYIQYMHSIAIKQPYSCCILNLCQEQDSYKLC